VIVTVGFVFEWVWWQIVTLPYCYCAAVGEEVCAKLMPTTVTAKTSEIATTTSPRTVRLRRPSKRPFVLIKLPPRSRITGILEIG
jgi:hypothetical protein